MAEPKQQMEDSSRLMSNHCATTSVVVNFLTRYLLRESWTQAWRTPPNIVEPLQGIPPKQWKKPTVSQHIQHKSSCQHNEIDIRFYCIAALMPHSQLSGARSGRRRPAALFASGRLAKFCCEDLGIQGTS